MGSNGYSLHSDEVSIDSFDRGSERRDGLASHRSSNRTSSLDSSSHYSESSDGFTMNCSVDLRTSEDCSELYSDKCLTEGCEQELLHSENELSEGYIGLKPDLTCPICLCKLSNLSLLNHCYHAFCLRCIKTWAERSNRCPLCNSYFTFVYYDFSPKSPLLYKKFIFDQSNEKSNFSETKDSDQPSTSAPSDIPQKIYTRREVYALNLYPELPEEDMPRFPVKILNGIKQHEEKISRWIERDLSAIFPDTNVEILAMHVIGCIKSSSCSMSEVIIDSLKEYLDDYTQHFALELALFARSKLSIEAYDKFTKYTTRTVNNLLE